MKDVTQMTSEEITQEIAERMHANEHPVATKEESDMNYRIWLKQKEAKAKRLPKPSPSPMVAAFIAAHRSAPEDVRVRYANVQLPKQYSYK